MAYINRKDSNGTKGPLVEGELGLDVTGSDDGRIGVGTATGNVLLAKKDEVDALDTRVSDIEGKTTVADYGITDAYTKVEVDTLLDGQNEAVEIAYDNTTSGLTATTVQEAVNELSVEKQDVLTEGAFVDGDKAKLDLIEDGATADQTGAEIKALYEAEANTNVYTDAEKTLVDVSTGLDTTATTLPAAVNELHGQVTALENRELTHKVDGTVAPTVTDDADAGFEVGSLWIDTVADEAYRCADATAGAAVWVNTTLTADELSALLISYDNTVSGLVATTVKDAIDEIDGAVDGLKATTGTTVDTRYDKLLAVRDVISMDYTSGNLDYVRYEGDDDATVYYRDVMTYNVDGNLIEVKHYWNTADLVTASGQTVLTYSAGDLATATYSE
jgi:hypothetical protein